MTKSDFQFQKIGVSGRWQALKITKTSDGEHRHWPGKPHYRPSSEENYLILLGNAWAKETGIAQLGIEYYIDKLPAGYGLFEQPQIKSSVVYKRLFGHPGGKFFDSSVRFQVHFLWLMSGMKGDCECILCSKKKPAPFVARNRLSRDVVDISVSGMPKKAREPILRDEISSTRESSATGIASGRARRDVKQSGAPYAVDEEGTEDVFKIFIKRLEGAKDGIKGIDDDIRETNSIDWRAEHEFDGHGDDILLRLLTQIEQQHSFIPRVGELVLWCPNFLNGHYLMLDLATSEYKFYSFDQRCFHGFPAWRAGVVTAVPSETTRNGPIDFPDLLDTPEKSTALNTAGFRIETFPDPNDALNKSLSKQYRYVPLRSIRPLSHWQSILRNVPQKQMHPSIKYALTCMTSISLFEKFKAVGMWPEASIHCKAIYLGSELITIGDTVRLASRENPKSCTDVLVVDSILLNLHEIQAEQISPRSPLLSSKTSITLVGRAYTTDIRRHYEMPTEAQLDGNLEQIVLPPAVAAEEVRAVFRPVGTSEYGSWYPLHHPYRRYEVSHDQVLGRMYEADAVRLWTGQLQHKIRNGERSRHKPSLDFDVRGIKSARRYATDTDSRIPEAVDNEIGWFWADSRAEALAVETFNGLEVGRYHDIRDKATLRGWNVYLKILSGQQITSEGHKYTDLSRSPISLGQRGRKPGSKVVNGKVIYPGDHGYDEATGGTGDDSASPSKPKPSSQMAGAALASTDDEENESDHGDRTDSTGVDSDLEIVLQPPIAVPKRRPAKTKEQIMSGAVDSIEGGQEFDDDDTSDDDDWFNAPLPLARGGTEESEGGDYDPKKAGNVGPGRAGRHSKFEINLGKW